jgi:hypothetical protein
VNGGNFFEENQFGAVMEKVWGKLGFGGYAFFNP